MGALAAQPDTSLPPAPKLKEKAVKENVSDPRPIKPINDKITGKGPKGEDVTANATTMGPSVAVLTIYADPSYNGPTSGNGLIPNYGSHAWIMLTNIANSNIKFGMYSNIAPWTAVTFGTWWSGSTDKEHNGLYYDLEEREVAIGKYSNRVGVQTYIDQTTLKNVNNYILSQDTWWSDINCSTFAKNVWNCAVLPQYSLTAAPLGGFDTPLNLANFIKVKFPEIMGRASTVVLQCHVCPRL